MVPAKCWHSSSCWTMKSYNRGKTLAQFKLEEPVVVLPLDRFVIRSYSPVLTIGGGQILDAHPHKHKRLAEETISHLNALQEGSDKEKIGLFVSDSAMAGLDLSQLVARMGKEPAELSPLIRDLVTAKKLILIDKESHKVIATHQYEKLKSALLEHLKGYPQKISTQTRYAQGRAQKQISSTQ